MEILPFTIENSRWALYYLYDIAISLNIECTVQWSLKYYTRASIYSVTNLFIDSDDPIKMMVNIDSMKVDDSTISGFFYFDVDSPLTDDEKASIFESIERAIQENAEKLGINKINGDTNNV